MTMAMAMAMRSTTSSRAVQPLLRRGRRRLQHHQQYHANNNVIHPSSNVAVRAFLTASASASAITTATGRRCSYYNNSYCRSIRGNGNNNLAIVGVGVNVNTVKTNASSALRFYSATAALDQQQQQQQQQYYDDDDYDYNDTSNSYSNSNDEATAITATNAAAQEEPNYSSLGSSSKLNLFTAINSAMRTAMQTDPTAIVFGEDVAFGGVFRCSQNLREEFGEERVFNTPLSENGIAVRELIVFRGEWHGLLSAFHFC